MDGFAGPDLISSKVTAKGWGSEKKKEQVGRRV
jgi:hypothetical protein